MRKGDVLNVKARVEASDWVKVSTSEELEGWVAVEYVALNFPLDSIPWSSRSLPHRPLAPLPL